MLLYYLVGLLLLQICIANDPTLDNEWQAYKERHSKQYINAKTDALRRGIWETNMRYIERHNEEAARGLHTYTLGMNVYGDIVRNFTNKSCLISIVKQRCNSRPIRH